MEIDIDAYTMHVSYKGKHVAYWFDYIDPGIDDWAHIFKTILYWLTYAPEMIDEVFKEGGK